MSEAVCLKRYLFVPILCVFEFCLCVCVPTEPEEGVRSQGTGVKDSVSHHTGRLVGTKVRSSGTVETALNC